MHCQYPDERVMWCANEGMVGDGQWPGGLDEV